MSCNHSLAKTISRWRHQNRPLHLTFDLIGMVVRHLSGNFWQYWQAVGRVSLNLLVVASQCIHVILKTIQNEHRNDYGGSDLCRPFWLHAWLLFDGYWNGCHMDVTCTLHGWLMTITWASHVHWNLSQRQGYRCLWKKTIQDFICEETAIAEYCILVNLRAADCISLK